MTVAKELGISAQQIANWKRQFNRLSDKQFNTIDGVDYSKKESEELRRLRRENKRLQEEMGFLKRLRRTLRKTKSEVRHYQRVSRALSKVIDVSGDECVTIRIE